MMYFQIICRDFSKRFIISVSHYITRQQLVACSDAESPEIVWCSFNGPSREDDAFTRVHACMHARKPPLFLRVCVNNNDWPTRVRGGASSRSRVVHRGDGGHARAYVLHWPCACVSHFFFSLLYSVCLSPSLSLSHVSLSLSRLICAHSLQVILLTLSRLIRRIAHTRAFFNV